MRVGGRGKFGGREPVLQLRHAHPRVQRRTGGRERRRRLLAVLVLVLVLVLVDAATLAMPRPRRLLRRLLLLLHVLALIRLSRLLQPPRRRLRPVKDKAGLRRLSRPPLVFASIGEARDTPKAVLGVLLGSRLHPLRETPRCLAPPPAAAAAAVSATASTSI